MFFVVCLPTQPCSSSVLWKSQITEMSKYTPLKQGKLHSLNSVHLQMQDIIPLGHVSLFSDVFLCIDSAIFHLCICLTLLLSVHPSLQGQGRYMATSLCSSIKSLCSGSHQAFSYIEKCDWLIHLWQHRREDYVNSEKQKQETDCRWPVIWRSYSKQYILVWLLQDFWFQVTDTRAFRPDCFELLQ